MTDVGTQSETAAQALHTEGVRINYFYFLYYLCLHVSAGYFNSCSHSATLYYTVHNWEESNLSDSVDLQADL